MVIVAAVAVAFAAAVALVLLQAVGLKRAHEGRLVGSRNDGRLVVVAFWFVILFAEG